MTDLGADPDNLTQFFELIAHNQKANAAKFSTPFLLLRRVNICLSTAGKNLINPKPMMAGVLFLRCQYTFQAAAGMALAGQAVETFVMMRSCLEYAGYALAISPIGTKYDNAVACLTKDRQALLTFFDFPAEHCGRKDPCRRRPPS
jgi:hypothetical protein